MSSRASQSAQAGLEVVPDSSGLEIPVTCYPEVYHQHPEIQPQRDEKYLLDVTSIKEKPSKTSWAALRVPSKRAGRKKPLVWIALGIAILSLVAVAIAVPVYMKSANKIPNSPQASSNTSGSPPDPATPSQSVASDANKSQTGAYNGTGLTIIGTLDNSFKYRLVYQHASGQIRQSILSGTWSEGGQDGVIVDRSMQAKNGTPIAGSSYPDASNISTYHIIFATADGTLHDRLWKSSTNSWNDGNLSRSSFKLMDSPSSQISFIWASDWAKGDSDGGTGPNGGLKVYWTGTDNRIHEASQPSSTGNWTESWLLDGSIAADRGFDAYVVNSNDLFWGTSRDSMTLTYSWHDYNTNGENTTDHPRGTWAPGKTSSNVVANTTAMSCGGSDLLYYQNTQNNIIGIYTNRTAIGGDLWGSQFQIGTLPGIAGTKIKAHSFFPTDTTGPQIRIYFQETGNTITEWIRGRDGGDWSKNDIPVLK